MPLEAMDTTGPDTVVGLADVLIGLVVALFLEALEDGFFVLCFFVLDLEEAVPAFHAGVVADWDFFAVFLKG
jgi:hypothetical protein